MNNIDRKSFIIGLLLIFSLLFDNIDASFLLVGLAILVLYFIFGEKKIACWKIKLEEVEYKIEFIRNLFKTESKVITNGQVHEDVEVILDNDGADYHFTISDYQCIILVRSQEEELKLDLTVEGQLVKNSKQIN